MRLLILLLPALPALAAAQSKSVDWPVYGGITDHTHYSTLDQITPANVGKLQVAWTYETHDEFPGSEMQANPIVVDGVLYATTPKLRVFALDAATGKELWSFDPNGGAAAGEPLPASRRRRHRRPRPRSPIATSSGRSTRKPASRSRRSASTARWICARDSTGRPTSLSVSASTPGVVFEDMLIIGSTVSETLPASPGDIRAYDVKTGALRWSFHTIPHPGEFGYETWPPDAYKVTGGANAWSGVTVDHEARDRLRRDGLGVLRLLRREPARRQPVRQHACSRSTRGPGKRIWHFQGVKHDLWDRDFPAAPALVTVTRDGRPVDAVAQITKTGYVYVFDRETGKPLFPIEYRKVPASTLDGERAAETQPFPVESAAVRATDAHRGHADDAHARGARGGAQDLSRVQDERHVRSAEPPRARSSFPGVDGGGEWGGPAFDPETGLLYVNSNEMPWLHQARAAERPFALRRELRELPWRRS